MGTPCGPFWDSFGPSWGSFWDSLGRPSCLVGAWRVSRLCLVLVVCLRLVCRCLRLFVGSCAPVCVRACAFVCGCPACSGASAASAASRASEAAQKRARRKRKYIHAQLVRAVLYSRLSGSVRLFASVFLCLWVFWVSQRFRAILPHHLRLVVSLRGRRVVRQHLWKALPHA